jgi:uncharacterized protein YjcR
LNTLKEAIKIIDDIRAENALLKVTINKRNRHVDSLKAIIKDLKAQTKIIFEGDDID